MVVCGCNLMKCEKLKWIVLFVIALYEVLSVASFVQLKLLRHGCRSTFLLAVGNGLQFRLGSKELKNLPMAK